MTHQFKPFDKVLHRPCDDTEWVPGLYSRPLTDRRHYVQGMTYHQQCIPYEGNEHLLGTKDSPAPACEFKYGDKVTVIGIDREERKCIFIEEDQSDPAYWRVLDTQTCRSLKKVNWKLRPGWDEEDDEE